MLFLTFLYIDDMRIKNLLRQVLPVVLLQTSATNKAVRVIPVSLKKGKSSHTITIGSLDEAVRIQEVYIE